MARGGGGGVNLDLRTQPDDIQFTGTYDDLGLLGGGGGGDGDGGGNSVAASLPATQVGGRVGGRAGVG